MTVPRSLPFRVDPVPGEAIDSWLEAIAFRADSAWGDLLDAVDIPAPAGLGYPPWTIALSEAEVASLCAATGSDVEFSMMTLTRFDGTAVRIDSQSRSLRREVAWTRRTGSRFCPHCLRSNGGRWKLEWRLGWAFACTDHRCLLSDECPRCHRIPRRRPLPGHCTPIPGRCASPAQEGGIGREARRCGADLTAAEVLDLPGAHPALRAQALIDRIIDDGVVRFGVYARLPQPAASVLADIRAIGGRVLSYATDEELLARVGPELAVEYRAVDEQGGARSGQVRQSRTKPALEAPARAVTAAIGVSAAIDVLHCSDLAAAADRLRWLVTSARETGLSVQPTNIGWGTRISPILTGVQLAALSPMLDPSDQLRYRTHSDLPTLVTSGRAELLARHTPTQFWAGISLPFTVPAARRTMMRLALSAALQLVGTRLNLTAAGQQVGGHLAGHALSRFLQILESDQHWSDVCAGLTRVADYVVERGVPIDYQRRRALDCTGLLPDDEWRQICHRTGTPSQGGSARAAVVRAFLREELTGVPTVDGSADLLAKIAAFPRDLTPGLRDELINHARVFLDAAGIDEEPIAWEPPIELLAGLDLPGPRPGLIDRDRLRKLIRERDLPIGAAARDLGTTGEAVRLELIVNPLPVDTGRRKYASARTQLPPEALTQLYHHDRLTLRQIANRIGVSRQVIRRLLTEYEIPTIPATERAKIIIDRDWLYQQYVTNSRALPDIARELGMSTANLARWANKHEIPMRPRGGPSHTAALDAAAAAKTVPPILRTAVAAQGGRDRLERAKAASRFPTLTEAAHALGTSQATLTNQFLRLERETGGALFDRAERNRPMTLTAHGRRVIDAIRKLDGTARESPGG